MKKILIMLAIMLLFTGCSKDDDASTSEVGTQTDITDIVDDTVEQTEVTHDGELIFESDTYQYYLLTEDIAVSDSDMLSDASGELPTNIEFQVSLNSVNLETNEVRSISENYSNTYFTYEFEAQNKVFYSTENFSLGSETWHGALFCLDQKAQTFAPILSNTSILLANTDDIAYFYDYTNNPILISLDLNTLQSKFLVDLPDLVLDLDCEISGKLEDDILYVRTLSSDIIVSEVVFSIKDTSYTISDNYKSINFFKTNGVYTAYDAQTHEIYNVARTIHDVYDEEILYSATEYVDNGNVVLSAMNATYLSPVFSSSADIQNYAIDCLSEHLYSASFNSLSYSDFVITDNTRADNDDGTTTFTYNYLYQPTTHYAIMQNKYSPVGEIDYQKGSFIVQACYLVNRYVIDFSSEDVLPFSQITPDQKVMLYQYDDFVFESSRILESYAENSSETYSTGEYIYSYMKSTMETLDLAQTTSNTFFLDATSDKVFLTSTQAPTFQGYNTHKISYIDLNTYDFVTLDPTLSIVAIKDSRAYYIDENNKVGYFSYFNLGFNEIGTYVNGGTFANGATGYIDGSILYVKFKSENTSIPYQAIALNN